MAVSGLLARVLRMSVVKAGSQTTMLHSFLVSPIPPGLLQQVSPQVVEFLHSLVCASVPHDFDG